MAPPDLLDFHRVQNCRMYILPTGCHHFRRLLFRLEYILLWLWRPSATAALLAQGSIIFIELCQSELLDI